MSTGGPPRPPPSLIQLATVTAIANIQRLSNITSIPDNIVEELFEKTLAAGKLTEPVLRMFLATGNVGILEWVKVLRIRPITNPIFPTRCSERQL